MPLVLVFQVLSDRYVVDHLYCLSSIEIAHGSRLPWPPLTERKTDPVPFLARIRRILLSVEYSASQQTRAVFMFYASDVALFLSISAQKYSATNAIK